MRIQKTCEKNPGLHFINTVPSGMTGKYGWDSLLRLLRLILMSKLAAQEIKTSMYKTNHFNRTTSLTEHLIDSYIMPRTISRNARLALLRLYAEKASFNKDSTGNDLNQGNLYSACFGYFSDYSMKTVCFHDLRPYVSSLTRKRQEQFLVLAAGDSRSRRPKPKAPEVSRSCTVAVNGLIE
jgi:hypothetical protein